MPLVIYGGYAETSAKRVLGANAHAEGVNSQASAAYSHAEGANTQATNSGAHAEGSSTVASGAASHAEGNSSTASANSAHAEGLSTTASGLYSHSEGNATIASGDYAHAEGVTCTASGTMSHAQGQGALANKVGQHAQSAFSPASLGALQSQYSTYVSGCMLSSTNGATADLSFDTNGTILSGSTTDQLVLPLRSVILVRYDIVARCRATSPGFAVGAGWSGTLLVGRMSATGTAAGYATTQATAQFLSGTTSLTPNWYFDTGSAGLQIQFSINSSDTTYNYLKMTAVQGATTLNYAVVAVLHCTELVSAS